jgi:hypothetical protein
MLGNKTSELASNRETLHVIKRDNPESSRPTPICVMGLTYLYYHITQRLLPL